MLLLSALLVLRQGRGSLGGEAHAVTGTLPSVEECFFLVSKSALACMRCPTLHRSLNHANQNRAHHYNCLTVSQHMTQWRSGEGEGGEGEGEGLGDGGGGGGG